jgi:hypothetical protein
MNCSNGYQQERGRTEVDRLYGRRECLMLRMEERSGGRRVGKIEKSDGWESEDVNGINKPIGILIRGSIKYTPVPTCLAN